MLHLQNNKLVLLLIFLTLSPELYAEEPYVTVLAFVQQSKCILDSGECQKCATAFNKDNNRRLLQWLLIDATKLKFEDCVVRLLQLDVDPNYFSSDKHQPTPLETAIRFNATNIVKHLISVGADPDVSGHYGLPPVVIAIEQGYCQMIPLLFARGGTPNPIVRDDRGAFSPLTLSVAEGQIECTRQLVRLGVDINQPIKDERQEFNGRTILELGLAVGKMDYVRSIVSELGADTGTTNSRGDTVLLIMVINRNKEAIKVLVEDLWADISAPNANGYTSIDIARHLGDEEMALYLEEYQWKHSWRYQLLYRPYEAMADMDKDEVFVYTINSLLLGLIPLSCIIPCCKRCRS